MLTKHSRLRRLDTPLEKNRVRSLLKAKQRYIKFGGDDSNGC